jgi:multidrug efflux pump subunit AcrA (membrane-fusion protein)
LRPEMNARVNFLSDKTSATENQTIARVLVPKTAVVKKENNSFVFVVKGNKVEQRTIRTGEESGDAYVVIDGLSGNESVAVAGVDKLSDGDRVKVQ